eukprot:tig00020892_g14916.t1
MAATTEAQWATARRVYFDSMRPDRGFFLVTSDVTDQQIGDFRLIVNSSGTGTWISKATEFADWCSFDWKDATPGDQSADANFAAFSTAQSDLKQAVGNYDSVYSDLLKTLGTPEEMYSTQALKLYYNDWLAALNTLESAAKAFLTYAELNCPTDWEDSLLWEEQDHYNRLNYMLNAIKYDKNRLDNWDDTIDLNRTFELLDEEAQHAQAAEEFAEDDELELELLASDLAAIQLCADAVDA